MNSILNQLFLGSTVSAWIAMTGTILLAFIIIRIVRVKGIKKIKALALKSKTTWDDFFIATIEKSVIPLLYISTIYFSLNFLVLPKKVMEIVHVAYLVAVTFFVLRIISSLFQKFVYTFIRKQENGIGKEKQARGMIIIVNAIIWIIGIIFLIDNLGYNVTTLIAGLGIGGIAIALAAQAILGDLFSYFVIFFDRPFEIGDFVVVDDKSGIIEHIGIKTTRIRTLGGEQLICSNTDLTNARLHNYKRLERRRVIFNLGVTYQTSHQQLSEIPQIVKDIIMSKEKVEFDRGHFSAYGDFSLLFEFVYYILSPEYNVYMDIQQSIYLDIFAAFENRGIEFAYPTQTLFIEPVRTSATSKATNN